MPFGGNVIVLLMSQFPGNSVVFAVNVTASKLTAAKWSSISVRYV